MFYLLLLIDILKRCLKRALSEFSFLDGVLGKVMSQAGLQPIRQASTQIQGIHRCRHNDTYAAAFGEVLDASGILRRCRPNVYRPASRKQLTILPPADGNT